MFGSRLAVDHVVFDLDGTLVDSRADLAAAVNHMLHVLGLAPLTTDQVTRYVGEGARKLVERALGAEDAHQVDEALPLFREFYRAHLLDRTRLYPGVAELLAILSESRLALSVLSNKPVAMSRAILDGLQVSPVFRAILGGDSLTARKPDPAGVEYIRALTNTSRDRMLLVGDSMIDVRTARAAGVAFCGVAWGFAPDDLRTAQVEPIIDHPGELLDLVAVG
ncbi:MAG: phosphoglycolate phosphatase [Acidobacteria bacterium RBG_16_68_9]|nr:MAG: phosphoglycolate phosphatase [Acidobacteria bacterium RBG_16_68_9]